jgi:hypothetical protein
LSENKCGTIIFKPRIINSIHTSSDSLHRRGVTLSLATRVDDKNDEQKDVTEITSTGARVTRFSSRNLAGGER